MLFILILQVISAVAFSVTKVMPFRGFSCIIQKKCMYAQNINTLRCRFGVCLFQDCSLVFW